MLSCTGDELWKAAGRTNLVAVQTRAMFELPALARTLEAAVRDATSKKAKTRASAFRELARHAQSSPELLPRVEPLLLRGLDDEDADARAAAALALGDTGASSALSPLLLCIEDAHAKVREMAIMALGALGDARAVPRLRRALRDERPEVRFQALQAMVVLNAERPEEVAEICLGALGDTDSSIRHLALRAAEEPADGLPPVSNDALVRAACGLLGESDLKVRAAAAIYLAKLRRSEAATCIAEIVEGKWKTPDIEDEEEAVLLAGFLDLRHLTQVLEQRAYGIRGLLGGACAMHAKMALARMGHERAVGEIVRDLDSWRLDTRTTAAVAAGLAGLGQAVEKLEGLRGSIPDQVRDEALRRIRKPGEGRPGAL